MISIVVPVYYGYECLDELCKRIAITLQNMSQEYEILLINDSSPDNSWIKILQLSKDKHIKGLNFSRNFGQHNAITAGIDYAIGDYIVVMDCDLQDPPEAINILYDKLLSGGYDVVFAARKNRKDGLIKRLESKGFSRVFRYFTDIRRDSAIGNFSIITYDVAYAWKLMREQNRSYPLMLNWLGFNVGVIDIEQAQRFAGESSYNFKKGLRLAANTIISQTNKPLRLSIQFGFVMAFCSFIIGLYFIYRYFAYNIIVQGWTSVIVAIFFIGGLLFANLGIIGLYVGKIFNETKNRPLYVVKNSIGFGEKHDKSC